jgi:hypothetical protein
MKHISLAYRSLLVYSLIVIVFCAAVNCTHRESKRDNLESVDASANDTCNVCNIHSFFVKLAYTSSGEKLLIDRPVAIKFFNQVRLADKYEIENYDTLMKLFKMKHSGDRGVLQALKNQYFYFTKTLEPVLVENSIEVIDSIQYNRHLEFRVSDVSVFVNPKDYKGQDGVLFFIPGKQPLFWTADREERYCRDSHGIVAQYFLCSTALKIAK